MPPSSPRSITAGVAVTPGGRPSASTSIGRVEAVEAGHVQGHQRRPAARDVRVLGAQGDLERRVGPAQDQVIAEVARRPDRGRPRPGPDSRRRPAASNVTRESFENDGPPSSLP